MKKANKSAQLKQIDALLASKSMKPGTKAYDDLKAERDKLVDKSAPKEESTAPADPKKDTVQVAPKEPSKIVEAVKAPVEAVIEAAKTTTGDSAADKDRQWRAQQAAAIKAKGGFGSADKIQSVAAQPSTPLFDKDAASQKVAAAVPDSKADKVKLQSAEDHAAEQKHSGGVHGVMPINTTSQNTNIKTESPGAAPQIQTHASNDSQVQKNADSHYMLVS